MFEIKQDCDTCKYNGECSYGPHCAPCVFIFITEKKHAALWVKKEEVKLKDELIEGI